MNERVLRPYQIAAVNQTYAQIRAGRAASCCSPPRAGEKPASPRRSSSTRSQETNAWRSSFPISRSLTKRAQRLAWMGFSTSALCNPRIRCGVHRRQFKFAAPKHWIADRRD